MINDQIESGKPAIRHALSWEFWHLPKDGKKDSDEYNNDLFDISAKYLAKFTEQDYEKYI